MVTLLSKREKDIMVILWKSPTPLKASEICKIDPSLTINTVQSVLTKLLQKELIKVEKIEYSGTVLARCFAPAITPDDYALKQLDESLNKLDPSSPVTKLSKLVSYFLDGIEEDQRSVINELEKILEKKKEQLNKHTK